MTNAFLTNFGAAKRVSTPLIAVQTADPAATVQALRQALPVETPLTLWDIVRGIAGVNDPGKEAVEALGVDPMQTTNLVDALTLVVEKFPEDAVIFVSNAQAYLKVQGVSQAIWNCRDPFKATGRTLVLFTPPSGATLPAELQQDVLVLDEPLPTAAELATIVRDTYAAGDLAAPAADLVEKAVDAIIGLAAFPAEQVAAMSLTAAGMDLAALWERKRQVIEQAPGLAVWRGGERFSDVGGCENVKTFLSAAVNGEDSPRVVVFIDEIEKAMAGSGGSDTSGVSQEMLGTLLTEMQDQQYTGCIFIGPPGAAKSAVAKAVGGEAGIPTISFDLSAMKGSLVGESGANLRAALKVVRAVSQGRALFIATCNKIASLPPELRRRFTFGTFFFDLPSAEERAAIWKLYETKFKVSGPRPADEGWTGAEIRQCCDLARRLRIPLVEAASYIVPVAKSASDDIDRLRQQASGRFISASNKGIFRADGPVAVSAPKVAARKISVPTKTDVN